MDDIVAVNTSKGYICFEILEGEYDRKRRLYEKLLDHTKHLKFGISYAKFKASAMDELELCVQNARRVLETALDYFQTSAPELKEEIALLLNEWSDMEKSFGELGDISLVKADLPKKLQKKKGDLF